MMLESPKTPRDMLGRSGVISLSEARHVIEKNLPLTAPEEETVGLQAALGRIVSRQIISPEDLPSHPRSTMDGYAVQARDTFGATEGLPAYITIDGEVRMGECPGQGPSAGGCFIIATGGLLPPGTDAVVMLEHTVPVDQHMIEVVKPVAVGANCMAVGEDIAKEEVLFGIGHCLRPQDLGLLAGLGITSVPVFRKVRVAVISTGDELVEYKTASPPGKIRDSNSIHLTALAEQAGALVTFYGIVPDVEEELLRTAKKAVTENDVVLFSGSSSVGSRDLGERVIDKLGNPGILFHGVAVKPGKPVIFALAEGKPVFGLPGHPVSAAVSFAQFVDPVLHTLAGRAESDVPREKAVTARLLRNVSSAAGRTDFIRVHISRNEKSREFEALPVLSKSGAISSMAKANGYFVIQQNQQGVRQEEMVTVFLYE